MRLTFSIHMLIFHECFNLAWIFQSCLKYSLNAVIFFCAIFSAIFLRFRCKHFRKTCYLHFAIWNRSEFSAIAIVGDAKIGLPYWSVSDNVSIHLRHIRTRPSNRHQGLSQWNVCRHVKTSRPAASGGYRLVAYGKAIFQSPKTIVRILLVVWFP